MVSAYVCVCACVCERVFCSMFGRNLKHFITQSLYLYVIYIYNCFTLTHVNTYITFNILNPYSYSNQLSMSNFRSNAVIEIEC